MAGEFPIAAPSHGMHCPGACASVEFAYVARQAAWPAAQAAYFPGACASARRPAPAQAARGTRELKARTCIGETCPPMFVRAFNCSLPEPAWGSTTERSRCCCCGSCHIRTTTPRSWPKAFARGRCQAIAGEFSIRALACRRGSHDCKGAQINTSLRALFR